MCVCIVLYNYIYKNTHTHIYTIRFLNITFNNYYMESRLVYIIIIRHRIMCVINMLKYLLRAVYYCPSKSDLIKCRKFLIVFTLRVDVYFPYALLLFVPFCIEHFGKLILGFFYTTILFCN